MTDSVVTDAIQRSHLIEEEEIDVVNIHSQLKDSQVDVNMLRQFLTVMDGKESLKSLTRLRKKNGNVGNANRS